MRGDFCSQDRRPCRRLAQAPLEPFSSRAYRLIELLSFASLALPAIQIACSTIHVKITNIFSVAIILDSSLCSDKRAFCIAKAFWNHRHCRWFSLHKQKIRTDTVRILPLFIAMWLVYPLLARLQRSAFALCGQSQT